MPGPGNPQADVVLNLDNKIDMFLECSSSASHGTLCKQRRVDWKHCQDIMTIGCPHSNEHSKGQKEPQN